MVYDVTVRNRIITLNSIREDLSGVKTEIVGGNKGDIVYFSLDDEWTALMSTRELKASFVWRGKYYISKIETDGIDAVYCYAPPIFNTNSFYLGIYVGEDINDPDYMSTTKVEIPCRLSIRDYMTSPQDDYGGNYTDLANEAADRAEEAADRTEELLTEYIDEVDDLIDGDGTLDTGGSTGGGLTWKLIAENVTPSAVKEEYVEFYVGESLYNKILLVVLETTAMGDTQRYTIMLRSVTHSASCLALKPSGINGDNFIMFEAIHKRDINDPEVEKRIDITVNSMPSCTPIAQTAASVFNPTITVYSLE